MSREGAMPIDHDEASRALPWLVNGTLPAEERERVERHVHDCLACRAELREQHALRELVRGQPDVFASAEHGFAALAARLQRTTGGAETTGSQPCADDRGATASAEGSALGDVWEGLRRFSSGGWRLVTRPYVVRGLAFASLASLAVAVLLWAGLGAPGARGPAYRTLSAQQDASGARIDIVFSPGATEQDMRDVLSGMGATIVGGPSAIGRYTVALDGRDASDAAIDALIQRLREDGRVRFAGRSYIAAPAEDSPRRAGRPR